MSVPTNVTMVVTPDGEISFFTENGDYAGGAELLESLLSGIEAEGGFTFDEIGKVETHIPGGTHDTVHAAGIAHSH